MRQARSTLVGGYHRPSAKGPGKPGLHAVSPAADVNGARRSVCGIFGRFMPIEDWLSYPETYDSGCCDKCVTGLSDAEKVGKAARFAT